MNWNEQAETMAKTWVEAQKKMWEKWYDLGQAQPASTPFTDMADRWREMATQGVEAWTANADSTAKNTAERLLEGQKATMRFLEFSANAWQKIAEKVQTGEDWQSMLAEYVDQLHQQLIRWPEAAFNMSQDSGQLWQTYMEEVQNFVQPWLKSWQQAPEHLDQNRAEMLELTRLYWDTYEQTFGRFLESPSLGYSREMEEKINKGFKAWQRYRRVDFEYQLVVAEAWIKLFEQFQRELVTLAEKGETVDSLEALANLWVNIADPIFIETFHSEKYIQAQNELVRATMLYRLQQREIIEMVLEFYDIPTRTEVDEAHRNIYKQRKEIKSLKKALAEASGSMNAATKKAEASTRTELSKAQQTVAALQEEVKILKDTLAEVSAGATQLEQLRQEVETLKQSVAKAAAPAKAKRTTKPAGSSVKQKRATAKTDTAGDSKEAS